MGKATGPQRFGKCLIEREIGRGARSIVYLARHEGLQIPVAVKVLQSSRAEDDGLFSERFMREARIAAQLTHTSIVRVYDCGERGDDYYLVLEFIDGESCKDRMRRRGAFDAETAVGIIRSVADGLRYASTKGIIHRDLKPENIMIDRDGAVRIADLGLAKEVATPRASATADGDVLGTPYYMSPEQVRQPADVDFRSDIYSLGATFYHMVTGVVPFEAPTPFEIMTMHLNEPVPHPQTRRADLSPALCDVIMRMMAKEPQSRYQSYGDLIRDLDALGFGEADAGAGPFGRAGAPVVPPPDARVPVPAAYAATVPLQEEAQAERIEPECLPATVHCAHARAFAALSAILYAVFGVCLYLAVRIPLGSVAGLAVMLAFLAVSVGWAVRMAGGIRERDRAGERDAVEDLIALALGRLCDRLSLAVPRVRMTRRSDALCLVYGRFGGRAVICLPGAWLRNAAPGAAETDALLAQGLAGVYSGAADLRTALAVPVSVLGLIERVSRVVARCLPGRRKETARAAAGLLLAAVVPLALLVLSPAAGFLGLLFLGVLMLTAAFERESVQAADDFAARVVEDPEPVQSVILLGGLAGPERGRLLRDGLGAAAAAAASAGALSGEERERILRGLLEPGDGPLTGADVWTSALGLLSRGPSAARRIRRLAAAEGEGHPAREVMALVRHAYSRLLVSTRRKPPVVSMADLAGVRSQAIVGGMAGATALCVFLFMVLTTVPHYLDFLLTVGVLAAVAGTMAGHQFRGDAPSAGLLGWRILVATTSFVCSTMLGLCLADGLLGQRVLSRLALQLPLLMIPLLAVAALAGGLFVRWTFRAGRGTAADRPSPSRTAHTAALNGDGGRRAVRMREVSVEDEPPKRR
ncbi:MAG: serine/threonine protein kinase [Candidatus Brocadiaceae bacterium]|mgnify:CR=1 FL=1|nr:serine/threonine protein kinase [Candidatus Brocadiaceae bacterium]